MNKAALLALSTLMGVAACVSDPVKKKPGTIDVMTTGGAGTTADPNGAAGATAAPSGTAGATTDPTSVSGAGAAGMSGDSAGSGGVPDPAGAAGSTSDPTGAAGSTSSATGAAGAAAPVDASGTAGAGDAGVQASPDASQPPPIADPCDHRTWTFTPSVVCTTACAAMTDAQKLPANAIDGNTATRYTTGITQGSKGPEVVILTFPKSVTLSGINLFTKSGDGPMSYLVESSLDGANFTYFNPSAMGPGSDNLTITFPAPSKLLALRITQTGVKKTNWWSIHELTVLGCAQAQ
jgi:hypothetical protein